MNRPQHLDAVNFLSGGGAMGALIRDHDWAATPLGPPRDWPQSLRSALSICLHSSFPTAIYWGPDLRVLYNDAWAPIPAERHPWALGRPAAEVWPDIWNIVGPQFARVMETGEGFSAYDELLPMERDGVPTEAYWNYSFTAIRGEDGSVVGIFNQGNETTDLVLARREARAEADRLASMFAQAPGAIAMTRGPEHVFEVANPAYCELVNRTDLVGKSVAEALPEVVEQGFIRLLDQVYTSGETHVGRNVPITLDRGEGRTEERIVDFVYQPVNDAAGQRSGIFVQATDLTNTSRAETALRDSEERYEAIVNSIDQMIWSTRPDGFHDFYNDRWYEFTGVPKGSTDGEAWNGMFHPEDQDRAWEVWRHSLATGEPYHIEYRLRHRSGEYRWVIGRAQCIRDAEGRIVRWFGSCTDIHQQKLAEQEQAEQARILEILYRTGNVIGSNIDLETVVQTVTDAGVDLTGARYGAFYYNRKAADGGGYELFTVSGMARDRFDGFPLPQDTEALETTFGGRAVVRTDDITRDARYGRRGPCEGRLTVRSYLAVPVVSRSGEVIGGLFFGHPRAGVFSRRSERLMAGVAAQAAVAIDNATLFRSAQHEIAERRKNEIALRESESFIRSVVESSGDCIKVMELDGSMQFMNENGKKLLEIDDFEAVRKHPWWELWPEESHAVMAQALASARDGGTGRFSAYRPTLKGTPKWWDVVVTPILGAEGRPIRLVSISRDVTEQRRSEETRQLLLRELNHRVKNLFAITSGMISMTARNAASVSDMAEALKGRIGALAKAHELVRSAIVADTDQGVAGLRPILDAVIRPHADAAQGHRVDLSGPEFEVAGSAGTSLALIFHELATNAAKYGAFAASEGALSVTWALRDDRLEIDWCERVSGGTVGAPATQGFGSRLARSSVAGQLGGSIDYDWQPEGVRIAVSLPVAQLLG